MIHSDTRPEGEEGAGHVDFGGNKLHKQTSWRSSKKCSVLGAEQRESEMVGAWVAIGPYPE